MYDYNQDEDIPDDAYQHYRYVQNQKKQQNTEQQKLLELEEEENQYLNSLANKLENTEQKLENFQRNLKNDSLLDKAFTLNKKADQILNKNDSFKSPQIKEAIEKNFFDLQISYQQLQRRMDLMEDQFSQKNYQIRLLIAQVKKLQQENDLKDDQINKLQQKLDNSVPNQKSIQNLQQPEKFGKQLLLKKPRDYQNNPLSAQNKLYQNVNQSEPISYNNHQDPYDFWSNGANFQNQNQNLKQKVEIGENDTLWINQLNQANRNVQNNNNQFDINGNYINDIQQQIYLNENGENINAEYNQQYEIQDSITQFVKEKTGKQIYSNSKSKRSNRVSPQRINNQKRN